MDFYQDPPELKNTFQSDPLLSGHLRRALPADVLAAVEPHLQEVGGLASGTWLALSQQAERELPELITFDPWGRRIDEIRMSSGWTRLEGEAARHGIVAAAFERQFGEWSRVYQMALLYLFHPSSAFVSCPLAMTDGAARAIELYGDEDMKSRALRHLTSRDPATFWTSGQWMTERTGGSDVSGTATTARRASGGGAPGMDWELSGVKWFTSATTSAMAMLLARPEGAEAGSRGLSLFYTELRDSQRKLRNIEIMRLKDKLGTKALPTAELRLAGTPARLVGGEGHGVRKISSLFNITRVYNAICAIGHWRRALDLAWSYSGKRQAFGKKLIDHPLHRSTLDEQERLFKKAFDLTFYVAHLLGRDEVGVATESERVLLRALTPIAKLYTARLCMSGVSEVVEIFGGAGYVEDTGIPKLLRDAQVFSIWEGATNVLALDFLRALEKESAGPALMEKIQRDFASILSRPDMGARLRSVQDLMAAAARGERDQVEAKARDLSWTVAEIFSEGLARS